MASELALFVLWEKSRFVEERILADLRREMSVRYVKELRFEGDPALAFRRFYGPRLPDAKRKLRNCGGGAFLLVIVEDTAPDYRTIDAGGRLPTYCNVRLHALKKRYHRWAGGGHRIHGTMEPGEFARDVLMLTGHTEAEWLAGVPEGTVAPRLPEGWSAVSETAPFAARTLEPGLAPVLEDRRLFLENKYINDTFHVGTFCGVPAIEKMSAKAVWSIGNEYRLGSRMHAAAPAVVPMPLAWRYAGDGRSASVVTARVSGPSLTELLSKGVTAAQADGFAADILTLADALKATGIVHRDLFTDNLLLDADGHLKAIDWQLAIDRADYREDPWVVRHWKFRYVVFGVNRELGLGVWNDFHALGKILAQLPQTPAVVAAARKLAAEAASMTSAAPPDRPTRVKLWFYALSLRLQMFLRGRRHRKYAQLERRWRTVKCRYSAATN